MHGEAGLIESVVVQYTVNIFAVPHACIMYTCMYHRITGLSYVNIMVSVMATTLTLQCHNFDFIFSFNNIQQQLRCSYQITNTAIHFAVLGGPAK